MQACAGGVGADSAGAHPGFTASGRRKKPDKWGQELKHVTQEYDSLVKTIARLEEEQRALRVKEELLLHVAHSLQALVAEVSKRSSVEVIGRAPAAAPAARAVEDDGNLLWLMAVTTVQQREHEIEQLYGDLMGSLFPSHQQQLHGMELVKSLCRPDFIDKIASMTAAELTNRLSFLAGKIALQLHQSCQDTPPDPANAALQGPLHAHFVEFTGLVMSAMLWENGKFRSILHTNLDTLQPFAEPLPQQHWLKALERVQLSEQQLHVLVCLYDNHVLAKRTQVKHALARNIQQQEVHGQAYDTLLLQQQQQQQQQLPSVAGTAVTAAAAAGQAQAVSYTPTGLSPSGEGPSLSTAAAAAAAPPAGGMAPGADPGFLLGSSFFSTAVPAVQQAAVGREPMKQYGHVMETREALVEERHKLMRYWLLLGLHMGIVTACTLSPYQQAVFVASSYPSIPRIDIAIQAWTDQQQQLKQQQLEECKTLQQAQQGRRRALPVRANSGGLTGAATPEARSSR